MLNAGGLASAPWVCPYDRVVLHETPESLSCPRGHTFRIVNGVPRFAGEAHYVEHFGLQWNTYVRTQLDSYTGSPITANRLKRTLGEDLWSTLAGKTVLECGCGAGRFTEVLLARGALVTSIDLSSAVDANAELFPPSQSHRIAQANIMQLPVADQSFDVVLCLGVIQHTPDPEQTIAQLYRCVRPGGTLVIDHYAPSWRRYTYTGPLVRQILIRMKPKRALAVTRALVNVFLPLHKRFRRNRVLNSMLSRISPLRCYYREYPELSDDIQREWAMLDTHDSLTDVYKHLRSKRSIRRTLELLGLEQIWCERGGNGVEARGKRPA